MPLAEIIHCENFSVKQAVAPRLYLMKDKSENFRSPLSTTISTLIPSEFIYLTAEYFFFFFFL
jgi:hypothetical protein